MLRSKIVSKNSLSLLLAAAFVFLTSPGGAATYYVDATNGRDTNTGLSEVAPWKTIAKVNASRFNPGDQIFVKGGVIGRQVAEERCDTWFIDM
jgi:hypothetical protein